MTTLEFLFAAWGLLLSPGPTNTLLALSGAMVGLRRSLRLLPAELAGYLCVTLPLVFFGAALIERWPPLGIAIKLCAGVWVLLLAIRLWRLPEASQGTGAITVRRIFVTTLLNPKGLIFGLVLLPQAGSPDFPVRLLAFCLSVSLIALIWVCAGSLLRLGPARGGTPPLLRQIAAGWLIILAAGLLASVLPI